MRIHGMPILAGHVSHAEHVCIPHSCAHVARTPSRRTRTADNFGWARARVARGKEHSLGLHLCVEGTVPLAWEAVAARSTHFGFQSFFVPHRVFF